DCSILLLAAGESQGSTFVVRLSFFQADHAIRAHYVTGIQACALPISGNNSGSVTTTAVTPKADLAVTKTGPATAMVDSNFSYHRSEERRVGKEWNTRWVLDEQKAELSFVSFTSSDAGKPPTGYSRRQT